MLLLPAFDRQHGILLTNVQLSAFSPVRGAADVSALLQPVLAGLWRRLAALMYEAVLVFAIVFVAAYLFIALSGDTPSGWLRLVFYTYLLCVCGAYFVFC